MKSLKEQLNSVVNLSVGVRRIDENEQAALKRCILAMYIHLKKICDSHGLILMLTGGSCLGAVRHKGFIPWDDDLDLMMPRNDYNYLLDLCKKGNLGSDYEFTYPSKEHDAPCAFLKIYLKNSRILGIGGERNKYPQGVFIDVFPIDGVPRMAFIFHLKGFIADVLRLCSNMVSNAGSWSDDESVLYKQSFSLFLNMKCRQLFGSLLSVISHKRWIYWYDSFICDSIIGKKASIPTGRKLYVGETLPSSVFFPPSKGYFEGLEVFLPADPDTYLKNLYGNYMCIPPVDKRESHFIKEIELPEKYFNTTI